MGVYHWIVTKVNKKQTENKIKIGQPGSYVNSHKAEWLRWTKYNTPYYFGFCYLAIVLAFSSIQKLINVQYICLADKTHTTWTKTLVKTCIYRFDSVPGFPRKIKLEDG